MSAEKSPLEVFYRFGRDGSTHRLWMSGAAGFKPSEAARLSQTAPDLRAISEEIRVTLDRNPR